PAPRYYHASSGVRTITGNTMFNLLKIELGALGSFFKRNYVELVIICAAMLFLTLDEYNPISPRWLGAFFYFAVLPILTIIIFLRKNPREFGFRLGNWKVWSFHVLVTILIGIPVLYFSSRSSILEGYYTIDQFNLLIYSLETIVYMFAWEFLFRGFLLFGLKEKLKEMSVLVQMIPFILLHFGKPEIETISTIFMGLYLGYIVYRGNSFWPALIIHLFINISFRAIVNL
ncbi:MAG: CPBP family intramembrane metalloprotease, partial [Dehalococcoidales bacterium]|nr:CPBP family intramembrane metalloprotease [Dehalococcoidales bacterium]